MKIYTKQLSTTTHVSYVGLTGRVVETYLGFSDYLNGVWHEPRFNIAFAYIDNATRDDIDLDTRNKVS